MTRFPGRNDTSSSFGGIRRNTITAIDPDAIQKWREQEAEKAEAARQNAQAAAEALLERLRQQKTADDEAAQELIRAHRDTRRSRRGEDTQDAIKAVCEYLRDFLIEKNLQYGDSAINPLRIFSKASPVEQLYVRLDDKLSRISRGDDRLESDDDVLDDLIGYLIMLKVARRRDADADS